MYSIGIEKGEISLPLCRFHAFSIFDNKSTNDYEKTLTRSETIDEPDNHSNRRRKDKSLSLDYGVREDVMKIWGELDTARNTLAEIQALIKEFENPHKAKQGT